MLILENIQGLAPVEVYFKNEIGQKKIIFELLLSWVSQNTLSAPAAPNTNVLPWKMPFEMLQIWKCVIGSLCA